MKFIIPSFIFLTVISFTPYYSMADESEVDLIEKNPHEYKLYYEAGEHYKAGRYAEALKMYMELSKLGNEFGEYHLGLMYFHGHGVERNQTKAFSLLKEVMERTTSIPEAGRMLGIMSYMGIGVEQNKVEGLLWFRRSAKLGDEVSKQLLQQNESLGSLDSILEGALG